MHYPDWISGDWLTIGLDSINWINPFSGWIINQIKLSATSIQFSCGRNNASQWAQPIFLIFIHFRQRKSYISLACISCDESSICLFVYEFFYYLLCQYWNKKMVLYLHYKKTIIHQSYHQFRSGKNAISMVVVDFLRKSTIAALRNSAFN